MLSQQSGKALFPFLILVLLGLCVYLYLPKSAGQTQQGGMNATEVVAHSVSQDNRAVSVDAVGSARANQAINITSAQSDYVTAIYFKDGDSVAQGQQLVQLQDQQEKLQVAELSINLKEQRRQLERLNELAKSQSAAKSQLEEQRSKVDALQAQLDAARTKLQEMTITAPFAGVLGKRLVSVGAYVNTNTVLTTLDDLSIIKVDFQVPEKYLAQLKLGMKVTALSDAYANSLFTGELSHIDPRIDERTRSIAVTAKFKNKDNRLRPGMLLFTKLQLAEVTALMVPEKAIIPLQDKHFVYAIDANGKVERVQVKIQTRFNGWVAIAEGLHEGQQVITEGTLKLRVGSSVVVKG
ncbi:efflux RND transporter periplasmic adaptor subunit [Pseudoalteromonas fenneropenaei]|uniref:Efflux RND transporter periplasmic adaptor subunit n=1 Tax=Pseudoalteromonas fenneropenaei TaxID=1737459 RepID=A0ABV7CLT0_9GAMM